MLSNATHTTLHNGVAFPLVGFGAAGRLPASVLEQALDSGFRLIDTAQATEWYDESAVGIALKSRALNRSEVWLTSKLHPRDLGQQSTLAAFPTSLRRLHTHYLDAFLLHYPRCFGELCKDGVPNEDWRGSWRALEELYERKLVRSIGVSNFRAAELAQLLQFAHVLPHIVQTWMDPLHQERPLRALCAEHGIAFQAYSTLGTQHRTRINPVLRHPLLNRLSEQTGRSIAQVVLRWALQSGAAVIPRAAKRAHMDANLRLFDFTLNSEQMAAIDALDGTDPNAVVTAALQALPPKPCDDEDQKCQAWADAGECENNPGYMHVTCAGSCDTCDERDKHEL